MALTEARKGQIALLYLKNKLRNDGVRVSKNTKREIGNTAKKIGIPVEEAMEFAEMLTREMVDEAFGKKN